MPTGAKMNARSILKIALVIGLFLFGMGLQARAGSIVGWGDQVLGSDLSKGFLKIAAGGYHSLALKADRDRKSVV